MLLNIDSVISILRSVTLSGGKIRARFERFLPVAPAYSNWSLQVDEWWNLRLDSVHLKEKQLYFWRQIQVNHLSQSLIGCNVEYGMYIIRV